jgi:hypothetical protein
VLKRAVKKAAFIQAITIPPLETFSFLNRRKIRLTGHGLQSNIGQIFETMMALSRVNLIVITITAASI